MPRANSSMHPTMTSRFAARATAGHMIYITVDELIPNSCAGENHHTTFAFMGGVVLVVLLGLM